MPALTLQIPQPDLSEESDSSSDFETISNTTDANQSDENILKQTNQSDEQVSNQIKQLSHEILFDIFNPLKNDQYYSLYIMSNYISFKYINLVKTNKHYNVKDIVPAAYMIAATIAHPIKLNAVLNTLIQQGFVTNEFDLLKKQARVIMSFGDDIESIKDPLILTSNLCEERNCTHLTNLAQNELFEMNFSEYQTISPRKLAHLAMNRALYASARNRISSSTTINKNFTPADQANALRKENHDPNLADEITFNVSITPIQMSQTNIISHNEIGEHSNQTYPKTVPSDSRSSSNQIEQSIFPIPQKAFGIPKVKTPKLQIKKLQIPGIMFQKINNRTPNNKSNNFKTKKERQITKKPPYHCPICGKNFNEKKKRLTEHTPKCLKKQRNSNFIATCGKRFTTQFNLERHNESSSHKEEKCKKNYLSVNENPNKIIE